MEGTTYTAFGLKRIGQAATHPNVPDVLRLKKDVTTFGRLTANDHFLDSAVLNCMISRRHAEIRHIEGHPEGVEFEIIDHSLNGTYVNDRRVDGRHALHLGDILKFGHMNGVNIKPGQHAPQPNTEFVFQFTKLDDGPKSLHIPTTNGTEVSVEVNYNKSSMNNVKRRTSSSSSSSGEESPAVDKQSPAKPSHKKRKTQSSSSSSGDGSDDEVEGSNGDSNLAGTRTFSNEAVIEESKTAAGGSGHSSGSDEEIFEDIHKKPEVNNRNKNPPHSETQKKKTINSKAVKTQPRRKKDSISSAADLKKARRASKTAKQEIKTEDDPEPEPGSSEWWYYHSDDDKCAAPTCRRPGQNEVIDWVACDDCDQWWHTSCAGVTSAQIKKKSFQYHCGCKKKKKN